MRASLDEHGGAANATTAPVAIRLASGGALFRRQPFLVFLRADGSVAGALDATPGGIVLSSSNPDREEGES